MRWTTGRPVRLLLLSIIISSEGARFYLTGVAYANGRYVAVGQMDSGDFGMVQTSDDGVNWTESPSSVYDLYDVTFGNGVFVAVGWDYFSGQNIYHSTNGINWTPHTTAIANVNRVTFGNGLFVAVGDGLLLNSGNQTNQRIYTSVNGTAWTPRRDGGPLQPGNSSYLSDVAYGAGRFVAVDGSANFYTSTSGLTWTSTANSRAAGRISCCNGLFIASSGLGTNLVSSDGVSWSVLTNTTGAYFGRVIYAGGRYMVGSNSKAFTSTDGTNWVQLNVPQPLNGNLAAVAFGAGRFIVVGSSYSPSPQVPVAYISDPIVALSMNPGLPPQLNVSGLLGRSYRIEHLTDVQSTNWQTLGTFMLTNSPATWSDTTATNASRIYRAVLLP
jgi:hypothetical protein